MSWTMTQAVLQLPANALRPHLRTTLSVLAYHHIDDSDRCTPSTRRLAAMTGKSVRSVQRDLLALEEAGYILRERRWHDGWEINSQYHFDANRMFGPASQEVSTPDVDVAPCDADVVDADAGVTPREELEEAEVEDNYRDDASAIPEGNTAIVNSWSDDDDGLAATGKVELEPAGPPLRTAAARRRAKAPVAGEIPATRRRTLSVASLVNDFDRQSAAQFGFLPGRINAAALGRGIKLWRDSDGIALEDIEVMIEVFMARTRTAGTHDLWKQFLSRREELLDAAQNRSSRYVTASQRERMGGTVPAPKPQKVSASMAELFGDPNKKNTPNNENGATS